MAVRDHGHAVDTALDQGRQAVPGQALGLFLQGIAGDRRAQDQEADRRHARGQQAVGVRQRARIRARRQRHDGQGAHAGEVQRHDRQHQQRRGEQHLPVGPLVRRRMESRRSADHRGDHRGHDIGWRPDHKGVGHEGRHTGVVHTGDRQAEDRAARRRRMGALRRADRQRQTAADHRHHQRQAGQHRRIADLGLRLIRQHGHEMGAPDGRPAGHRAQEQPRQTGPQAADARLVEQAVQNHGAHDTDHGSKSDEEQIMLLRQAGQDAHGGELGQQSACHPARFFLNRRPHAQG